CARGIEGKRILGGYW
nr:immunoglobulin heavy chain junction region [Macaca mulatta]MOW78374.1 immunoglobulin heavy chain junction region [Macaca mulatta]MOW80402.1 immunoglobulin heavy chain junction region [Macaca mulatta]MOW82424.1 immunoglobulin heavy chain junction region [Macaca mulatta]MOW82784.1 immunoglobulin heavy chain junction region [Macaca mulatta]